MSNKFKIFENQTEDGDSVVFRISERAGVGISDTEFSAYFEIHGSLGGGTLSLQKECNDGTYREFEEATNNITTLFPSSGKMNALPMNYKDSGNWKFVLSGATDASLYITGINMQAGS